VKARNILIGFACAIVFVIGGLSAQEGKPKKALTLEHVKLAETLKDEQAQLQVENLKLQQHLAAFNVKVAEALVLFRKDLGAKSTDQFDFDALEFRPAQPPPAPQAAPGRGPVPQGR
jgi:hypothetical protein